MPALDDSEEYQPKKYPVCLECRKAEDHWRETEVKENLLHRAVARGDEKAVMQLLNAGASPQGDHDFYDGNAPPFSIACEYGHDAIAIQLLDAGARSFRGILTAALRYKRWNLALRLLDTDIDLTEEVETGITSLAYIIRNRQVPLIFNFLRLGMDPGRLNPGDQETLVELLVESCDPMSGSAADRKLVQGACLSLAKLNYMDILRGKGSKPELLELTRRQFNIAGKYGSIPYGLKNIVAKLGI